MLSRLLRILLISFSLITAQQNPGSITGYADLVPTDYQPYPGK